VLSGFSSDKTGFELVAWLVPLLAVLMPHLLIAQQKVQLLS